MRPGSVALPLHSSLPSAIILPQLAWENDFIRSRIVVGKAGLRIRAVRMPPTNFSRRRSVMRVGWRVARGRGMFFGSCKTKFELLVVKRSN